MCVRERGGRTGTAAQRPHGQTADTGPSHTHPERARVFVCVRARGFETPLGTGQRQA